jgi:hypothetical protein
LITGKWIGKKISQNKLAPPHFKTLLVETACHDNVAILLLPPASLAGSTTYKLDPTIDSHRMQLAIDSHNEAIDLIVRKLKNGKNWLPHSIR